MNYFSKYVKLQQGGSVQTSDAEKQDAQMFYTSLMSVPEVYSEAGIEIPEDFITGLQQDPENTIKANSKLIQAALQVWAKNKQAIMAKMEESQATTMKNGGKFEYIARLAKGGKNCPGCVKKAASGEQLPAGQTPPDYEFSSELDEPVMTPYARAYYDSVYRAQYPVADKPKTPAKPSNKKAATQKSPAKPQAKPKANTATKDSTMYNQSTYGSELELPPMTEYAAYLYRTGQIGRN